MTWWRHIPRCRWCGETTCHGECVSKIRDENARFRRYLDRLMKEFECHTTADIHYWPLDSKVEKLLAEIREDFERRGRKRVPEDPGRKHWSV